VALRSPSSVTIVDIPSAAGRRRALHGVARLL
jgi:hypothetical protein